MLKLGLKGFLSLESINLYAAGRIAARLSDEPGLKDHFQKNHAFLLDKIESAWPVYGAVTGFGSSSASRIQAGETSSLQTNLYRYHGCGVGPAFDQKASAAILLVRMNCLLQGASGVSFDLLERLQVMVSERIYPLVPMRGSVGASGDLTPLSYLAAALAGEREVLYKERIRLAEDVWAELKCPVYAFKAREALAIMNGTSVMSALSGLAWIKLERIFQVLTWSTAALVEIWHGQCSPFFAELHAAKPHIGQGEAAALIFEHLLEPDSRILRRDPATGSTEGAVQDPYSIRCSPQIIGAFKDALNVSRTWIETEINSVNDNPVILHQGELILNGGHFLGQHITMASDLLKASLANVINLADRQMALLMESKGLLPENLLSPSVDSSMHHGFKAMQITMSSLAAELAKNAMPMSVFSRPTEASNQDVVSMGTTSARELYQLADIAADAMAIHVMALVQALFVSPRRLNPKLESRLSEVRKVFPGVKEDRAMDRCIAKVREALFEDKS